MTKATHLDYSQKTLEDGCKFFFQISLLSPLGANPGIRGGGGTSRLKGVHLNYLRITSSAHSEDHNFVINFSSEALRLFLLSNGFIRHFDAFLCPLCHWCHQKYKMAPRKSYNKKVLQKRSPKKLSKIGLRVVQTAHRRRRVIENIALYKVVRLDLVGTGLKLEV